MFVLVFSTWIPWKYIKILQEKIPIWQLVFPDHSDFSRLNHHFQISFKQQDLLKIVSENMPFDTDNLATAIHKLAKLRCEESSAFGKSDVYTPEI